MSGSLNDFQEPSPRLPISGQSRFPSEKQLRRRMHTVWPKNYMRYLLKGRYRCLQIPYSQGKFLTKYRSGSLKAYIGSQVET